MSSHHQGLPLSFYELSIPQHLDALFLLHLGPQKRLSSPLLASEAKSVTNTRTAIIFIFTSMMLMMMMTMCMQESQWEVWAKGRGEVISMIDWTPCRWRGSSTFLSSSSSSSRSSSSSTPSRSSPSESLSLSACRVWLWGLNLWWSQWLIVCLAQDLFLHNIVIFIFIGIIAFFRFSTMGGAFFYNGL